MKTQRPLIELIEDIIDKWNKQKKQRVLDWQLYEIVNKKILKYVKMSLQEEMISTRAYRQSAERIPPINIHKRVVDKTSKVYQKDPVRNAKVKSDTKLMEDFVESMDLNCKLALSNRYLNSMFKFALEPYLDEDGNAQLRVVAPFQFMAYSDSVSNPEKMTVYVKLIATDDKDDILALYSDEEFLIVDTSKKVRIDFMRRMEIEDGVNPFGMIPVIYGKTTDEQLIPFANEEGKAAAVLFPKLITDINFAAKYLSHSIIYTVNVNLEKADVNADAIWDLGDGDLDGKGKPEVGTISPEVDIPNQISSIAFQMQNYFESVGIKTSVNMEGSNPLSAVSKAIDEGDISDIRDDQIKEYRKTEKQFWTLLAKMQEVWVQNNQSKIKRTFSSTFPEKMTITFPENKVLKTESQKLDDIEKWRDQRLMSRKQAIRQMRPEFTKEQVDEWLKEVDEESEEDFQRRLKGMGSLTSDKTSDGQFKEGNQEATKVQPENSLEGRRNGAETTQNN